MMIRIAKPSLGYEEEEAVKETLKSGIIAQGPKVSEFENRLADYCLKSKAVAVNSGTAALHTALHILGVGKGDEVITTPFTFIATANAVLMQHATPIFVDVQPDTFTINPEAIQASITKKTKAIITVDMYGHLCDYDEINKIAKENNIPVVEDACQAIGATYKGLKAGAFGDIGCFSFYATKNITSGEGGALITKNDGYVKNAKQFRQHGMADVGVYDYNDIGYNYRMTDISASILLEQLKKLDSFNAKRREHAKIFSDQLDGVNGITTPIIKKNHTHAFHQYTIKVDGFKLSRDELFSHLRNKGVECAIYYPKPLHMCQSFRRFGYKEGDCKMAERLSNEVISLPVHQSLQPSDLQYIVDCIKSIK